MIKSNLEGGCQCGAVRYAITGEPALAAICHCTMCRRAHAAPAVAWAMFQDAQVSFSKSQAANIRIVTGSQAWLLSKLRNADQFYGQLSSRPD